MKASGFNICFLGTGVSVSEFFAQRVTSRMETLGLSGVEVARYCGVSPTSVTNWRNGRNQAKGKELLKLSEILQCSPEWLLHGRRKDAPDAAPRQAAGGEVPLISKVTAGKWAKAEDPYVPGDAEQFIHCPVNHGPQTYALRVDGDSMTSQYGKSYPHGSVIYVDPDQRGGVVSGDRVIALLEGSEDVVFKQYVKEGSQQFLRSLNSSYPPITDPFRIIGKVIGKFEEE